MASSVCRVCLVGNISMLHIDDTRLLETYEKLTNTKLNTEGTGMPSTVCYVCHRQLQRCYTFYHLAHKSNKILQDLTRNGTEATPDTVTTLSPEMHNLSVFPTQYMSINSYSITTSIPAVKEEQVVVKEEPDVTEDIYTYEMTLETLDEDVEFGVISKNSEVTQRNVNLKNDPNTMHLCFYCNECNTKVPSKFHLINHLKSHAAQKLRTCNICSKVLRQNSDLLVHMRIHTGEKPYSCNKCDKTFKHKSSLKRHMPNHASGKPYSCNRCYKTFTQIRFLTEHMRVHNVKKPYSCKRCGKAFREKSNFVKHIVRHDNNISCKEQVTLSQCVYYTNHCELPFTPPPKSSKDTKQSKS